MTLPPFTDRIFYLDRRDMLAHISYLTSDMWVLFVLDDDGDWEFETSARTYEDLFQMIRPFNPDVLLEEPW
jgi:hypothetical protein